MIFNKNRIFILGGLGFLFSFTLLSFYKIAEEADFTDNIENLYITTIIGLGLGIAIDLLLHLFNLINIDALKRPLAFLNQGEKKILRSKMLLDAGAITEQEYQKRVQKFRAGME